MQVTFVKKLGLRFQINTYLEVTVLNIVHGADPVDSYIEKAEFTATGAMLTDDECQALQDQIADLIVRDWAEHMQDKAERACEGER